MGNDNKESNLNSATDEKELQTYLSQKAHNHHYYKHYTALNRIENILENHTIYLSNGKNWNDKTDRDNFNNEKLDSVNYGVCLSFSKSENVAMWMLYSGNNGAMLDYDKETIQALLDTECIELGHFQDYRFHSEMTLKRGSFEISIFDIVYYNQEDAEDICYVRRSSEVYKKYPKWKVDALTYQKKTLPWSYENECRLVVSIKREIVACVYDADTVAISFPKEKVVKLKKRTYHSPNSNDCKYVESKLKNKINWDLCLHCDRREK